MKVVEIFQSIDGEGIRQGSLVNFIRLAGCNLNCVYCDTKYANENNIDFKDYSIDDIEKILRKEEFANTNLITLTGGEPLRTIDGIKLANYLVSNGFKVNIETNGSVDITPVIKNSLITMDWKTKTSGSNEAMRLSNLKLLKKNDVLKIVCSEEDFDEIESLITNMFDNISSYIYLSPIFGQLALEDLVKFEKYLCNKIQNLDKQLRIQVQLHKIIWNPLTRGV